MCEMESRRLALVNRIEATKNWLIALDKFIPQEEMGHFLTKFPVPVDEEPTEARCRQLAQEWEEWKETTGR